MKIRQLMYEHYFIGIISIAVVYILPLISPMIYLFSGQKGALFQVMVLVAIFGLILEFVPKQYPSNDNHRLKIETLVVFISLALFFVYDLVLLYLQCESSVELKWYNFGVFGYVLIPLIVASIEVGFSFKDHYKSGADSGENKIATGNASNV